MNHTSINRHIPFLLSRRVNGLSRTILSLSAISPAGVGERFTLHLTVRDVVSLAGWQLDIAFSPTVLRAVSVSEGVFLSENGGSAFFQAGNINNAAGSITGISGVSIGTGGVTGSGRLLSITFETKSVGEGSLQLREARLGAANGNHIHYDIVTHPIIVKVESTYDLNGDGAVNVLDLTLVAQNFGLVNAQADVNGDGAVDVFDLIAVAQHADAAAQAPSGLARDGTDLNVETVQKWIDMAHTANDGSLAFQLGILNLERLLASMLPNKTALLANYPNPFNPETWIPYQLAASGDVSITIYDSRGALVRRLDVGQQSAGFYADRARAAYWDGRNEYGVPVTSGIYFYQLRTADSSQVRRMAIVK